MDIGATKVRGLLGVLAYKSNESVSFDYLADALWDDDRPPEPAKTLQVYVSRLRRAIKQSGAPAEVFRDHGAYRLHIDESHVDHRWFRTLVRSGHLAVSGGEHAAAADVFAAAVDLWQGQPLTDLRTSWASRLRESLVARDLLPARNALAEAKLAAGELGFVLEWLPPLLTDHPHDDRLAALWIRTLAAVGRSGEIPAFFREFSGRLATDLNAEPTPELVATYRNSLLPGSMVRRAPVRLRAVPDFVGRTELLDRLDDALLPPGRAAVVALDGRPGVGKTALVRHWARLREQRFPDGILHTDLGGYASTAPVEPGTALGMFLDRLGVDATRIPDGTDDRATVLRRTLSGRQVLVVLDNVRDSEHVRPLLLALADCPVVITSRRRLTGIAVRDGAERITVPELSEAEAVALMETLIGRSTAEESRELVALCERLALALRIVGEHVASRPEAPVRDLVEELREARRLLDAGAHGDDDTTLRSAFSWSYRALPPRHGELFRLLGLFPTTRFDAEAVAAAGGLDRADVDDHLDGLVGAHLVEQEGAGRFRTHDLIHKFAADTARRDLPADVREDARRRLYGWYVDSARNARRLWTADPSDVPGLTDEPVTGLTFDTRERAKRWFDRERGSLVALVREGRGQEEAVWRLAACLTVVYDHDLRELLEVHRLGRAAADAAGQPAAAAGCLTAMGVLYGRLMDDLNMSRCFEEAYGLFESMADTYGRAVSLHNLGAARLRLGRPQEAIAYHRRALIAFTEVGNDWAVANVLRWMGDDLRALGRAAEAHDRYRESLEISRALTDERGQGATLNRLAELALATARPTDAVDAALSGLDLHDRTGDRGSAADSLCVLAAARIELEEYAQATADATDAVQAHEQLHNAAGQVRALEILGRTHAAAGEHGLAVEAWSRATDLLPDGDRQAGELRLLIEQCTEDSIPSPRPSVNANVRSSHLI